MLPGPIISPFRAELREQENTWLLSLRVWDSAAALGMECVYRIDGRAPEVRKWVRYTTGNQGQPVRDHEAVEVWQRLMRPVLVRSETY